MTAGPLLIGLSGMALQPEECALLQHPQVGGVVLFSRNYETLEQLSQLTTAIHACRATLLIAVDQEGGRVQRFCDGFTPLPAAATLGEHYDQDAAAAIALSESCGWVMAIELLAVGIDLSFAPVLDLGIQPNGVIGDRAFHRDPEIVAILAAAFRRGMRRAGMSATVKHFPGHGHVVADSHLELPVDGRTLAEIELSDLQPFARMIANGVEGVMVAHIRYAQIDDRPAGFSDYWIKTILRGRLSFQGAIFSDDLHMQGAAWAGSMSDRVCAALNAGCDAALLCQDPGSVATVLDELGRWVKDPVSRLRLSRMRHPHPVMHRKSLLLDPDWQRQRDRLKACFRPYTADLPFLE